MSLSIEEISSSLWQKELSNNIYIYDELASTNGTAKEMIKSGGGYGNIVIADSQTAGKGRFERNFYSPSNSGIYISFVLDKKEFNLDMIVPYFVVAVCEAIETTTKKTPEIKWPNDIFIDGKKTCGILAEVVTNELLVVGIGINFNTTYFPDELKQTAGAIFTEENPNITREQLIAEIINQIITPKRRFNIKEIIEEYKKRLTMLGNEVLVTTPNEVYEAEVLDIDEVGRLIVMKNNGEEQTLFAGEISIKAGDLNNEY